MVRAGFEALASEGYKLNDFAEQSGQGGGVTLTGGTGGPTLTLSFSGSSPIGLNGFKIGAPGKGVWIEYIGGNHNTEYAIAGRASIVERLLQFFLPKEER
jgi:hypothetical protein